MIPAEHFRKGTPVLVDRICRQVFVTSLAQARSILPGRRQIRKSQETLTPLSKLGAVQIPGIAVSAKLSEPLLTVHTLLWKELETPDTKGIVDLRAVALESFGAASIESPLPVSRTRAFSMEQRCILLDYSKVNIFGILARRRSTALVHIGLIPGK